jgi:hypothetical protein
LATLRDLAENGILPVWSRWWGEGVLEDLVRDDRRRSEIENELPEVPLAFYEAPIELPPDWCTNAGAYVLLSEAYRLDASRAASLGWPVVERPGEHLDVVNDEGAIAGILLNLLE